MATLDDIPRTYDAAVRSLVESHADLDRSGMLIFSFPDLAGEVVRLLEISDIFPDAGRVAAFQWGRSADFPFKSIVAQITPQQWRRILTAELPLPDGWDLASRQQVWP